MAEKAAILIHVSAPTSLGKFETHHYFTRVGVFLKLILDKCEILYKLDKDNFKILVVHVDSKHGDVDKFYKLSGKRIEDLPPKGWDIIKITNNSYSGIKFELNISQRT